MTNESTPPNEGIPPQVQDFLNLYIDSIELLSVLLLLYSHPEKLWQKDEITKELRSTNTSISIRLNDLYARKILVKNAELDTGYKFTPSTPEICEVIKNLAFQYQQRPNRVIDAIYSRPSAIALFSNAFDLRGKKS
jgi:hypothetical protein